MTYLLRRNVERRRSQINLDDVIHARQNEEEARSLGTSCNDALALTVIRKSRVSNLDGCDRVGRSLLVHTLARPRRTPFSSLVSRPVVATHLDAHAQRDRERQRDENPQENDDDVVANTDLLILIFSVVIHCKRNDFDRNVKIGPR